MPTAVLKIRARLEGHSELKTHMARADLRAERALFEYVEEGLRILDAAAHQTINKSGRAFSERPPGRKFTTESTIEVLGPHFAGGGRVEGRVATDDEVAEILEKGSAAHIISPRVANALRFEIGGRVVYARRVQHPGTRAYRWLERAGLLSDAELRARFGGVPQTVFGFKRGGGL